MKQLKLILLLLLVIGPVAEVTPSEINNSQNLYQAQTSRGVTMPQVVAYLQSNGHTVLTTPFSEDGGYTWACVTSYHGIHFNTIVYTEANNCVGWEDIMID